ncbi:hypothetical protein [Acidianus brierleyi]|uniref:hypothetical protein n=1 Tax=Acidianus brierleyi TaxID=41673 RepID=UPI001FE8CABB|nr:hypothetical protein [Acidianus brierleyi]
MQRDLEINIPLCFSGIPTIVNNPLLIVNIKHKIRLIDRKPRIDISKIFKEATGFECKFNIDIENNLPFSSYYVIITKFLIDRAIGTCELPITLDEENEIMRMIDDALYDSELIRALRTAQFMNSSILYRDNEDPVKISFPSLKIRVLYSFPIRIRDDLDNSIIHTLGMIPVKFSEKFSPDLVNLENGLWHSLYSIFSPYTNNWKIIWDLNWATFIEFSNLVEV